MKVLPFQIPKPEQRALIYQVDRAPQFYSHLHQHEEIQVSLILAGEGELIVGDTVNFFRPNDIFIIGSNVPHLFRNNLVKEESAHMLTLFFTTASFGSTFFETPELLVLQPLLRKSESGIRIMEHKDAIKTLFLAVGDQSAFERFMTFLEIMKLSADSETEVLSSFVSQKVYSDDEGERMSKVMNYALTHFREPISLQEVSDLANMTPNAFCRYFKRRTRKTFFQFLLEIRIDAAARQLKNQPDLSVVAVSEASGFTNLSNFNRKFRALKGMTPREFRQSWE
ncbi:MAG: AraC family transcriptional regulator [bacterium]|nr:AraC family transcriptional regulator [bacterium]